MGVGRAVQGRLGSSGSGFGSTLLGLDSELWGEGAALAVPVLLSAGRFHWGFGGSGWWAQYSQSSGDLGSRGARGTCLGTSVPTSYGVSFPGAPAAVTCPSHRTRRPCQFGFLQSRWPACSVHHHFRPPGLPGCPLPGVYCVGTLPHGPSVGAFYRTEPRTDGHCVP